jgi:predicted DCC family thiol-disulfide oxidoreductase YuxK
MAEAIVIYDGDCAFCSSAARFAQRRIAKELNFAAYQLTELAPYGLTAAECAQSLKFVDQNGKIHSAQNAIAEILISSGKLWYGFGKFLKLPGINFLAALGYKFVAANRHRLPGGTPTCKMN